MRFYSERLRGAGLSESCCEPEEVWESPHRILATPWAQDSLNLIQPHGGLSHNTRKLDEQKLSN